MKIENIQTPALILDKKILLENIKAMNSLLEGSDMKLRPHYKSHKCDYLAHLQIQNGAKGMTCAKLSEAIDLADSGIEDILIANQITDPRKIRRLADLAGDCKLTVCVDSKENVKQLADAAKNAGTVIHCYIEFEIGMERCGVTEFRQVLELADTIAEKAETAIVLSGSDEAGYAICIISKAADTRELGKAVNNALNGRGGGKPGAFLLLKFLDMVFHIRNQIILQRL
jgi:D-serine deaminase-like pyridoxal phosphate-dependent protein